MLVSAFRRNELRFCLPERTFNAHGKVRDREDALASTRAACAPRSSVITATEVKSLARCDGQRKFPYGYAPN